MHQLAQPIAVFPLISADQQVWLGTGVRWGLLHMGQQGPASLGGLQVELIVTQQGNRLFAQLQAVLAKHLARGKWLAAQLIKQEIQGLR